MVNTTHGQYEDARERKHTQEYDSSATAPSSPQKKHRQYREYARSQKMREAVRRFSKAGNRVVVVSFHWTLLLETKEVVVSSARNSLSRANRYSSFRR